MLQTMKIGKKDFKIGERTYIMGILNVTPDSFSDGGRYNELEAALKRVSTMIEEGADIIDVGGESTRPGHVVISDEDEINRVAPVIKAIKGNFDIPVSVDTYKSKVAKEALEAGADLVNDIWGFKHDREIADITAKYGAACCLMHNRENKEYKNLIDDMISDLQESIDIALKAGVPENKIIIDPGFGFAKTVENNLDVMKNLEKLKMLGYPMLLGTSRKSTIGAVLDLPVDQRLEGTLATTVIGITKGCDFVRVHDILQNKRACVMTDAIIRR